MPEDLTLFKAAFPTEQNKGGFIFLPHFSPHELPRTWRKWEGKAERSCDRRGTAG